MPENAFDGRDPLGSLQRSPGHQYVLVVLVLSRGQDRRG